MPTPEPCLNCTCRKGVLLCFLRVCPTLIQSNPNDNCTTVREAGQCCPTLKCETLITSSDISNTTPTIPTTKSLWGFSETTNSQSFSSTIGIDDRTDPTNGSFRFLLIILFFTFVLFFCRNIVLISNETDSNRVNNSVHYYSGKIIVKNLMTIHFAFQFSVINKWIFSKFSRLENIRKIYG